MKLKNFLKLSLVLFVIFATSQAYAIGKPFRLGFKIGIPNVVSVNTELITPLFGNRLGLMADYSNFSLTIQDVKADFSYWELAGNMYIFSKGRGPYLSFSYMNMKNDFTYDDIDSELVQGLTGGSASTQVKLESFSIKIGAKLGGLFYFRPEVGYLFTTLPQELDVTVTFTDYLPEVQTLEIPSALTGSFIFNIGFGFAF